jgi:rod shape-determining protein MreD
MLDIIKYVFLLILLLLVQVFVLDNIFLFSFAHPVVFFFLLLVMPRMPEWLYLIAAFFVGLIFDSFYYTPGVNAAACVLIAFFRTPTLKYLKSTEEEEVIKPHIFYLGFANFFNFTIVMSLLFHLASGFLSIFSFNEIFFTLFRVIVNAFLSVLLFFILDILFFYRKGKQE